jgi:hypothetical protein
MNIPWTRWERRWRDALCTSMLPGNAGQPLPGLDSVDLEEFWRAYERAAPVLLRFGFRAAIWALTFSPPFVLGKPTTFPGLEPEDRDRLLDRMSGSRFYLLRQLPLTVKLMSCFAYLRDDRVRKQVDDLSRS